ncbi:Phospholipid phosphatase-related protein type [Trichinella pseudospiralis]
MFPSDLHLSVEHPAFFGRHFRGILLLQLCHPHCVLKSAASEFKFGSYFSADARGNFVARRGGGARAVLGLLIRALLEGLSACSEFCIFSSAVVTGGTVTVSFASSDFNCEANNFSWLSLDNAPAETFL